MTPQSGEGLPPVATESPGPSGRLATALAALVPVFLGVGGVIGSLSLGIGDLADPGPGLWPFGVSLLLIGVSAALLVGRGATSDTERFTGASLRALFGVASLVVLVVALPLVGFELPCALLMFVWLRFLGDESWRMSVATTIAAVAVAYVVFVVLLNVPLPHLF